MLKETIQVCILWEKLKVMFSGTLKLARSFAAKGVFFERIAESRGAQFAERAVWRVRERREVWMRRERRVRVIFSRGEGRWELIIRRSSKGRAVRVDIWTGSLEIWTRIDLSGYG